MHRDHICMLYGADDETLNDDNGIRHGCRDCVVINFPSVSGQSPAPPVPFISVTSGIGYVLF